MFQRGMLWVVVFFLGVTGVVRGENSLDGLNVLQVGQHGPYSMRVDLVIVGDGYIKEDFARGGKWEIDTARLIKNFFEKIPFNEYRSLFNVHLVEVISQDRGADDTPAADTKNTALGATYGSAGIPRLLVCNHQAVEKAARNAQAVDIILVLVNDSRPGGSGGSAGSIPASVCSAEATAYLTAIHELGHSFVGLADEYVDEEIKDKYPLPQSGDLRAPNVTLVELVDTSSKQSLIDTLKWGHFLEEPNFARKYGNGFYEGGYYRAKGVYRPARSCMMADQYGSGKFCYVCRAETIKTICQTSGRGAFGGIFPEPIPAMKGRLRRFHHLYTVGAFSRLESDLKKLAKKKDSLTKEELRSARRIQDAMKKSVRASVKKAESLAKSRDVLAASEQIGLLAKTFKKTKWEEAVERRSKAILDDADFKRELAAAKDFQKTISILRSANFSKSQKQKIKTRLEKLIAKHAGTKAAKDAEAIVRSL